MNLIVLVDSNWGIGKGGNQVVYIPADLKRFKLLTSHCPIIMGRKTLSTFPHGKPLPNRRNIVLSSTLPVSEDLEVFPSEDALLYSLKKDKIAMDRAFVVGGASVYKALLPYCDTAFVTKVQMRHTGADRFMTNLDKSSNWKVLEQSKVQDWNNIKFQYVTYVNKNSKELP